MTLNYNIIKATPKGLSYFAISFMMALVLEQVFAGPVMARGASVYTIAKVKIDAHADNAVIAKQRVLDQGPLQALKLIFKRFAPFRAYDRLRTLTPAEADDVIDGFAVRNERNSSTRYLASLDYTFSRKKLQALFVNKGVPFFDQRSRKQVLMPVFTTSEDQSVDKTNKKNKDQWWAAWRTIDFKHGLTDTRLYKAKQSDQESWRKISMGEHRHYGLLQERYAIQKLILVDALLIGQNDRLALRIYGEDHIGSLNYTQEIPLNDADVKKGYESAVKIAYGILEGRWREPQIAGDVVAVLSQSNEQDEAISSKRLINETVFLRVAFRGLRDWQQIRKRLQRIPGVKKMQVNSLSPRGADIRLSYPGGLDRLRTQLSAYRFALNHEGQENVLRSTN